MSADDAVIPPDGLALPVAEIAGGIAHRVLDSLIDDMRRPDRRAVYAGAIPAAIMCARARIPFPLALALSLAAGAVTRWAYVAVEDIRAKLDSDAAGGV